MSDNRVAAFAMGFEEYPRTLAFGPDGSLYVADASSLYRISVIPEPPSSVLSCVGGLIALAYARRAAGGRRPEPPSTANDHRTDG